MALSPDSPEGYRLGRLLRACGDELLSQIQKSRPDPSRQVVLVLEIEAGKTCKAVIHSKKDVVDNFKGSSEFRPEFVDYIAKFKDDGRFVLTIFTFQDDYITALPLPIEGTMSDLILADTKS